MCLNAEFWAGLEDRGGEGTAVAGSAGEWGGGGQVSQHRAAHLGRESRIKFPTTETHTHTHKPKHTCLRTP